MSAYKNLLMLCAGFTVGICPNAPVFYAVITKNPVHIGQSRTASHSSFPAPPIIYGKFEQETTSVTSVKTAAGSTLHTSANELAEKIRLTNDSVQATFAAQLIDIEALEANSTALKQVVIQHNHDKSVRIERRLAALQSSASKTFYGAQSYHLSHSVRTALKQAACEIRPFSCCYGNELQQVVHQECIAIIQNAIALPATSSFVDCRDALISCADAARAYNQAGATAKAIDIADLCWAFLDYGKAIAEGAIAGVANAVVDLAQHPVEAAACILAEEYVLAYQLCKVAYKVAELGVVTLMSPPEGARRLHEYLQPLEQVITAIANKEISLKDGLKGATQFAVQWKAQEKLLHGLSGLCRIAKARVLTSVTRHPLAAPETHMITPEGVIVHNGTHTKYESLPEPVRPRSWSPPIYSSPEAIEAAVKHATTDNKLRHFFKNPLHGFKSLLDKKDRDQILLVREIIKKLANDRSLPVLGRFEDLFVTIDGYHIQVRGSVHEGVIKIGTMFIPQGK